MGRAEYDEAFFLPPAPPDPFDASVDNAKEIGVGFEEKSMKRQQPACSMMRAIWFTAVEKGSGLILFGPIIALRASARQFSKKVPGGG